MSCILKRDTPSRFLKTLHLKISHQLRPLYSTGECWSGPNAQDTFFAQGAATDCNNDQYCDNQCYGQCRLEDSYCTGRHLTAAVYGIGKYQVWRHSVTRSERAEFLRYSWRLDDLFHCVQDSIAALEARETGPGKLSQRFLGLLLRTG